MGLRPLENYAKLVGRVSSPAANQSSGAQDAPYEKLKM
jgi:hypothetical protein